MDLDRHVFRTYMNMRIGIVILTLLLPVSLIAYGLAINVEIQNSLSAYYHAIPIADCDYDQFHALQAGQFLRSFFVGILLSVGALLYLYKGYGPKENIALNLAGIFALLVALFPMQWPDSGDGVIFDAIKFGDKLSLHGIAAVALVFCVAYVCIRRPSNTLKYVKDEKAKAKFEKTYNILGILMIALPVSVFVLLSFAGKNDKLILLLEIAVLVVFALFWWTQNREMKLINEDQDAAKGISQQYYI